MPGEPISCEPQLHLALHTAAAGHAIHPRNPWNKGPLTKHGHLDSTTDPATITAWWRLHESALVAIRTGAAGGVVVLDVDGESGRRWLDSFLVEQRCTISALSPYVVETPRNGLHLYFRVSAGTAIPSRAGDIAPHVDVRGEGGCIIVAGNRLPDGRRYRLTRPATDLSHACEMPRELLLLAMFNRRDRAAIASHPELATEIAAADDPAAWRGIFDARQRNTNWRPIGPVTVHLDAMRRQALSDLAAECAAYAGLRDGRRNGLFSVSCRLVRYVSNGVIAEAELGAALWDAALANGAVAAHGRDWFNGVLRRALAYGVRDSLPPLARRFREVT